MTFAEDKTRIRDAATVIVVRDAATAPRILMGQRGAKAAFMPNKFVFPGGALDADDADIPLLSPVSAPCHDRLREDSQSDLTHALTVTGIRELYEETGQMLASTGDWPVAPPKGWEAFADAGLMPDASACRFVFRALTPPGRPRRFDARFLLVDAAALATDPDDFSKASDELAHLQWVPLADARQFDMPFITEVVLSEIQALLPDLPAPQSVPFFKNADEQNLFLRLYGRPMDME